MRLKNKKVLVIGLGKTGQAVIDFLLEKNAIVTIFDDDESLIQKTTAEYKTIKLNNFDEIKDIDFAVVSPGVSKYNEIVKQCVLHGKKVVGELEFASYFINGNILALTGSNGKTTTVSLIKHIFDLAKKKSVLAGNIGVPLIKCVSIFKKTYIVEVSSFQLETSFFESKISGILNISENHLNRHFSMKEYFATKCNIFSKQTNSDYLVLNYDDERLKNIQQKDVKPKIIWYSTKQQTTDAFIKDNYFCYKKGKKIVKVARVDDLQLFGEHNKSNCLCAICYAMISKIKVKHIQNAIKSFKGVEHRVEFVKCIKGISFINDSKSTTPKSTEICVCSTKKPIILILGGSDKGIDYHDMVKKISPNVKLSILTGEIADKLKQAFDDNLNINYIVEKNFFDALSLAYEKAEKGDSVVLSPATASFDVFKNFEQRGNAFKEFVNNLDEK